MHGNHDRRQERAGGVDFTVPPGAPRMKRHVVLANRTYATAVPVIKPLSSITPVDIEPLLRSTIAHFHIGGIDSLKRRVLDRRQADSCLMLTFPALQRNRCCPLLAIGAVDGGWCARRGGFCVCSGGGEGRVRPA